MKTGQEEEEKGGLIIEYNKVLAAKKVLTFSRTGLVHTPAFLDLLFSKSLSSSEILSLNSFLKNFQARFQKAIAKAIEQRMNHLQFDITLMKLIDLECSLNGF